MIRKTLVLMAAVAATAVPSLALAGPGGYQYAKVVDVEPIYRHVRVQVPERECWTEIEYETVPRRYQRSRSSAVPTIAGGVIGGVVGRQFGKGDGRDAMTVLGTLIGAAVGHQAGQQRYADDYRYESVRERPVERCQTHYRTEERRDLDGYLVTYRYAGREYTTRTTEHPGERIRVRVEVTPASA
jgi:uncharacterized protein YcfJ